ncbi:MAG: glycosyltransferase family 4 protein [Acidobacteriota bacterium]
MTLRPDAMAMRAGELPAVSDDTRHRVARNETAGRVLIVGNFLHSATGTFGVCEGLAAELAAAGWDVVTTSGRPRRVARLADMLTTIWRERGRYAVAQVDVYSGSAFYWAEASCWLLRRIGRPYILTLHGGALPEFAARHPERVTRLLNSAAAVTTPSGYLVEALSRYRRNLILQPNPIAAAQYPFRVRRAPEPRLLWVRAFHRIYNPVMAVRVVASLQHDYPGVRLTMVGPDRGDGTREKTLAAAAELGVETRVAFPGAVAKSRLPEVFAEHDIFLNTTNVDNTPVTVVEAMACGMSVISTSVGGVPYLVRHEEDALLVEPDDADGMSAAVRRVMNTPDLAEKLSLGARQNALSRDWSILLPRWERLLNDVAAGREGGMD